MLSVCHYKLRAIPRRYSILQYDSRSPLLHPGCGRPHIRTLSSSGVVPVLSHPECTPHRALFESSSRSSFMFGCAANRPRRIIHSELIGTPVVLTFEVGFNFGRQFWGGG